MKKLALALLLVGGLGFATTSCDKEKTCVCETSWEAEDGSEYQSGDTDEVTTEESCSDLNETETDNPVEGVTKKVRCSEK